MPDSFDRDARELAKDAIAFYSRYANPLLLDALIDAARWAVQITEGDALWFCDYGDGNIRTHHKPSWCYWTGGAHGPDCGWRRLVVWEAGE